jgi:putative component of membrane protein insertase Oxa1/YidC/SpoIIIJ protein YidD
MVSTANSFAAQLADLSIGVYQRYISPRKGFCCAYRAHTGKRSCSAWGRTIVQKLGLIAFLAFLPAQFARCKQAYAKLLAQRQAGLNSPSKDDKRKGNTIDCNPCDVVDAATYLPYDAAPCDCSF